VRVKVGVGVGVRFRVRVRVSDRETRVRVKARGEREGSWLGIPNSYPNPIPQPGAQREGTWKAFLASNSAQNPAEVG
jgi:hypothetical protein